MGRPGFLQGWGTEAAASVRGLPRPPCQLLHPPGLGTPPVLLGGRPKVRCSEEALRAGATQLIPCPASPSPAPHGTTTYSVGEGKYWKSGDLQFLQKRNSLARSPPGLVLSDDRHYFHR